MYESVGASAGLLSYGEVVVVELRRAEPSRTDSKRANSAVTSRLRPPARGSTARRRSERAAARRKGQIAVVAQPGESVGQLEDGLEEPRQLVLVAHGKEDVEKAYAVLEEDVGDVSPSREVRVRREVDDEVAEGGGAGVDSLLRGGSLARPEPMVGVDVDEVAVVGERLRWCHGRRGRDEEEREQEHEQRQRQESRPMWVARAEQLHSSSSQCWLVAERVPRNKVARG